MLKKYTLLFRLFVLSCLIFFGTSFTSSVRAAETVGQNIALGKSYTFSPAPNLGDCIDAGDSTQLTDGSYESGHWTYSFAVGWETVDPIEITFDLGEIKPIEGLAFSTVINRAGAAWPSLILMLVSDDGDTWYAIGNLIELDMNDTPNLFENIEHQYKTMSLATHGRYVKLISNATPFLISDEVEIYRGPDENLDLSFAGTEITDIPTYLISETVPAKLRTRLHIDSQRVNQEITAANLTADIADPLRALLEAINLQIPSLTSIASPATFTTVFPINDLHRQIFAVQAAVWRALGLTDIVAWKSGRYDPLSPTEVPTQNTATIDVAMMSNEYRSDVINLGNAKSSAIDLTLTIEGLPAGDNPGYVTVHEVPFTDTSNLVPIASALPIVAKQNGQYIVTLPAGLTKQIWLEFHPTDVVAGDYQGDIKVEGTGITTFTVPINLTIYPMTFPDKPSLHLGGWDYTDASSNRGINVVNKEAFIAKLQAHYVDTPWATNAVMTAGSYNSNGHLTVAPNPAAFNAWVALWPNANNYFVFTNVNKISFAGFSVGSAAFQTAVKEWTAWWANYLQSQNIAPSKLKLLLVDEPLDASADNAIIAYGEAIRSAQTEINIFEDPAWPDPNLGNPQMFAVSDILSPHLPTSIYSGQGFKDFYAQQQVAGRELWFYSAGVQHPLRDPYLYNRLSAWMAWKYGAKGIEMWAFGDTGNGLSSLVGNSWNEYSSITYSYTPLFIDSQTITDAKHMEALREGVEDYEYLKMLQDRITILENAGKSDPAIDSAKSLLDETGVMLVTNGRTDTLKDYWNDGNAGKDRSVADQVRIDILESLKQLSQLQNSKILHTTTTVPVTTTTTAIISTSTTTGPTTTTSISGGGGGGGGGGSKSTTTTAVSTTTTTAAPSTTTTSVNTTTTVPATTTTTVPVSECIIESVESTVLPLQSGILNPRLRRILITGTNSKWDRSSAIKIKDINFVMKLRVEHDMITALIVIPPRLLGFQPGVKDVTIVTGSEACIGTVEIE